MKYWAVNKRTGVKYGPYTEAAKNDIQTTHPRTYHWKEIPEKAKAPRPEAVKSAKKKSTTTKKRSTKKKSSKTDDE